MLKYLIAFLEDSVRYGLQSKAFDRNNIKVAFLQCSLPFLGPNSDIFPLGRLPDIKPYTPRAIFDREQYEENCSEFEIGLVASVVGMSEMSETRQWVVMSRPADCTYFFSVICYYTTLFPNLHNNVLYVKGDSLL